VRRSVKWGECVKNGWYSFCVAWGNKSWYMSRSHFCHEPTYYNLQLIVNLGSLVTQQCL
jgi:hypothetical protein